VKTFENWCALHRVQPLPAAPADVAKFITDCAPLGIEKIWPLVVEISQAHSLTGLADPTLGGAAAGAVNEIAAIDPPRSWTKTSRFRFLSLPYDLQVFVVQREAERDTAVRRAQNSGAEKRKLQNKKVTHGTDSHPAA
jgi:hypothetical protein